MKKTVTSTQFYNFSYIEDIDSIETRVTRLHVADHLNKAFAILPSNANIDKGRCGIGGTSLEIVAERHSIFIVCTLGGILGKAKNNPSIFPIYGKMKSKAIIPELNKGTGYRKLFVTPDSFWKIIEAAKNSIGLKRLFRDFFVLYDESHTAITEAWRPNVLAPFEWIWKFKNKSFITATPCELNNPNFLKLQNYRIEFHEPYIGKVNVVECSPHEISSCVDAHIASAPNLPGSLFIFYNSVKEIAETIKHNGLTDCHIYCADKGDNYEKLPDQLNVFKREPESGKYAKVNFFTTRYFECFDLFAKNATIILVTDITRTTTRVGISNKGVQAIGRIRDMGEEGDKPNSIIHITNHRGRNKMRSRVEFKRDYNLHKTIIDHYNKYVLEGKSAKIKPLENYKDTIKAFSDIDPKSKIAVFNQDKLDQIINELVSNQEFNHIDFIINAWRIRKYDVHLDYHRVIPELKVKLRMSKKNRFKQIINLIHCLETAKDSYHIGTAARTLIEIQKDEPLAFEAYYKLSIDRIEELDYNEKQIKLELILLHNSAAMIKLLPILSEEFKVGPEKFTSKTLIDRLQYLYNKVDLRDLKSLEDVRKARLIDFEKEQWFSLYNNRIGADRKRIRTYSIIKSYLDYRTMNDIN
jgi:hypothetical protein